MSFYTAVQCQVLYNFAADTLHFPYISSLDTSPIIQIHSWELMYEYIPDPVNECPTLVITYVHQCASLLQQCSDIKQAFSNSVEQRCLVIAVSSVAVRTVLYQPPAAF